MKLITILSALSMTLLMAGCGTSSTPYPSGPRDPKSNLFHPSIPGYTGGINVGNPDLTEMTAYTSYKYHFTISYAKSLSLKLNSTDEFSIDNALLANPKNVGAGEVSKTSFRVLKQQDVGNMEIKTVKDLDLYLKLQFPHVKFQSIDFPGASGFFNEVQAGNHLEGQYYILTPNANLLFVSIDAFESGNGIKWVAPIVKTFGYDGKPPIVYEFKMQSIHLKAGQIAELLFRASDDYSGIDLNNDFYIFIAPNFQNGGDEHYYKKNDYLVKPVGIDWYSIQFKLSPYLATGEYYLDHFTIQDRAGNAHSFATKNSESPQLSSANGFYFENDNRPSNIPVLKFQVINDGQADVLPPAINAFRVEPATILAGETGRLFFKGKDDISGLKLKHDYPNDFSPNTFSSPESAVISIKGDIISRGDDWYSIDFKTSPYLPSGTYSLNSFNQMDNAGNEKLLWLHDAGSEFYMSRDGGPQIPVLKLNVVNRNQVDIEPPKIYELKVEPSKITVGQPARLLFRAKDNISGIEKMAGQMIYFELEPRGNYFPPQSAIIEAHGNFEKLENDWYAVNLYPGQYMPTGTYYLRFFRLGDLAGNFRLLNGSQYGSGSRDTARDERYYQGTGEIKIPILRVQVKG